MTISVRKPLGRPNAREPSLLCAEVHLLILINTPCNAQSRTRPIGYWYTCIQKMNYWPKLITAIILWTIMCYRCYHCIERHMVHYLSRICHITSGCNTNTLSRLEERHNYDEHMCYMCKSSKPTVRWHVIVGSLSPTVTGAHLARPACYLSRFMAPGC